MYIVLTIPAHLDPFYILFRSFMGFVGRQLSSFARLGQTETLSGPPTWARPLPRYVYVYLMLLQQQQQQQII